MDYDWYQKYLHIVMLKRIEQVAGKLALYSGDPGSTGQLHKSEGQLGRTGPEQDQLWLGPQSRLEGTGSSCHRGTVLSA